MVYKGALTEPAAAALHAVIDEQVAQDCTASAPHKKAERPQAGQPAPPLPQPNGVAATAAAAAQWHAPKLAAIRFQQAADAIVHAHAAAAATAVRIAPPSAVQRWSKSGLQSALQLAAALAAHEPVFWRERWVGCLAQAELEKMGALTRAANVSAAHTLDWNVLANTPWHPHAQLGSQPGGPFAVTMLQTDAMHRGRARFAADCGSAHALLGAAFDVAATLQHTPAPARRAVDGFAARLQRQLQTALAAPEAAQASALRDTDGRHAAQAQQRAVWPDAHAQGDPLHGLKQRLGDSTEPPATGSALNPSHRHSQSHTPPFSQRPLAPQDVPVDFRGLPTSGSQAQAQPHRQQQQRQQSASARGRAHSRSQPRWPPKAAAQVLTEPHAAPKVLPPSLRRKQNSRQRRTEARARARERAQGRQVAKRPAGRQPAVAGAAWSSLLSGAAERTVEQKRNASAKAGDAWRALLL